MTLRILILEEGECLWKCGLKEKIMSRERINVQMLYHRALSDYQEPIGPRRLGRHGKVRSTRPSFVILRAILAPAGTVAARLIVVEMVTVAPVFTSTGNGCTSAASIDPTLVSAPSV